jgi:hypothetical protein
MLHPTFRAGLVAALLAALPACRDADADDAPPAAPAAATAAAARAADSAAARVPLVATPDTVRGLYVNRWAAIGEKMGQLVDVARRTEVNALVLDVKDDRGFMLYKSRVPLANEIGADADSIRLMRPARLRAVLDTMRAHGIYPIARIVVVKDPLLAERKPEWAIRRRTTPRGRGSTRTASPGSTRTSRASGSTPWTSRRRPSRSASARCSSTTCASPTRSAWPARPPTRSRRGARARG